MIRMSCSSCEDHQEIWAAAISGKRGFDTFDRVANDISKGAGRLFPRALFDRPINIGDKPGAVLERAPFLAQSGSERDSWLKSVNAYVSKAQVAPSAISCGNGQGTRARMAHRVVSLRRRNLVANGA
jgi:hypothetical protein